MKLFSLPFPEINNKAILVVMFIVSAVLIVDTMVNQVSDFLSSHLISNMGVASFAAMCVIAGIGQLFILRFVNQRTHDVRSPALRLRTIRVITVGTQYLMLFVISIIICEIISMSLYHTDLLIVVTSASYILNVFLLSLFSQRLFSWYKSIRISVVVLLYAISFSLIAVSSITAIVQD